MKSKASPDSDMTYRAVRCILDLKGRYLLAVHNNYLPETIGKWGLPGGHIETGEAFEVTSEREMFEEFGLSLSDWQEVADYPYRGFLQKVLATKYEGSEAITHDPKEILKLAWYSLEDIEGMHHADKLHTGFELEAITSYRTLKQ